MKNREQNILGKNIISYYMAEHNDTGKKGEDLAASFLEKNGYSILEKNWLSKNFELDIVAKKGDTLFVIEVKTRQSNYLGEPQEWVSKKKQQQIIKGANAYVIFSKLDIEVQFDIITVIIKGDQHLIHHIQDAFYARL